MKKTLGCFLLFIVFFTTGFNIGKEDEKNKDAIYNSVVVASPSPYKVLEKQVTKDVEKMLNQYHRTWSWRNKKKLVAALIVGQYEYQVNYKNVLTIIGIESQFKITARGYNKRTKYRKSSYDYGLTQQNQRYYKARYKVAQKILNKYEISSTNSRYDIYKNVLSCFSFLRYLSNRHDINDKMSLIHAYNKGVNGMKKYMQNDYYMKFKKQYASL